MATEAPAPVAGTVPGSTPDWLAKARQRLQDRCTESRAAGGHPETDVMLSPRPDTPCATCGEPLGGRGACFWMNESLVMTGPHCASCQRARNIARYGPEWWSRKHG